MKTTRLKQQLLLLAVFVGVRLFASPGDSCTSAISVSGTPVTDSLKNTQQEWFSFVATSSGAKIKVTNLASAQASVTTLMAYSGSCLSLSPLGDTVTGTPPVDSLYMEVGGLTVGNTYYVKLERQDPIVCTNCSGTYAPFSLSVTAVCYMVITTPNGGCAQSANNPCTVSVCAGSQVCFALSPTDQGLGGNCTWTINGSNCTPTTLPATGSLCCTFSTPGSYSAQAFQITAANYPALSNFATINVVDTPTVNFTVNPNPVCLGSTVGFTWTFTGTNVGNPVSLDVDFGDGNTQTYSGIIPATINYAYSLPGLYTATICISNGACDPVCVSHTVEVVDASAAFTFNASCRVMFYDDTLCHDNILSESWDFGDGNTATGPNPVHHYTHDNVSYTVVHTVVTANGTYTYTATVTQPGGPDATITGYAVNNCGSGVISYSAPCDTNMVYTWSTSAGSSGTVTNGGCGYDVNWSAAGGYVVLTAFDPINDCTTHDTLRVPSCCSYPTTLRIDNKTASWVLTSAAFAPFVSGTTIDGATTTQHIVITGVFIVDTPFTFKNWQNIDIGANTPLYINPSENLNFNNSKTSVKCDTMWYGIIIPDSTAKLTITNGSVIQQAKNAVVSQNGGVYVIQNAKLKNNLKDIVVEACPTVHNGMVTGTEFVMNGAFLPSIPATPSYITHTLVGIEVTDNAGVTIGDASSLANRNTFRGLYQDIKSVNSRTTVYNCRFARTTSNFLLPNSGTCVLATGAKNQNYIPRLIVGGGTGLQPCIFDSMKIGVDAHTFVQVYANNNTFKNFTQFGVRVNSDFSTIDVSSNKFNNSTYSQPFNTAILMLDDYSATITINDNTIDQYNGLPQNQTGIGIRVGLASPGIVYANIANNTMNRVQTGAWGQNLQGKNTVNILSNKVNFTKANQYYTAVHYGIRLENCATVLVDANIIKKTDPAQPTLGMRDFLRGVSIENSPVTKAVNNNCVRMGSGLYGYAISSQSTLACNTMNHCYNGTYLTGPGSTGNACDIGDQVFDPLGTPAATGNTWIGNIGTYQVDGAVSPAISWRYDVTAPTIGALNATPSFNGYNACGSFFLVPAPATQRDQEAGAVIRSMQDTTLSAAQVDQMRRYVHRKLTQHPDWLSLNTADDSIYQHFFAAWNPTDIGLFRGAEMSADTGNAVAVASIASAAPAVTVISQNLKTVYEIYAATWMQGIYGFSAADSATLLNIALQDPVDGGSAVYNARVMLDYNVDYFGGTPAMRIAAPAPAETGSAVKVYPNPATDQVNLQLAVAAGQVAKAELYDLTGKLLVSETLAPEQGVYQLNTSGLQPGTYIIRIWVDGVAKQSERLVIFK